jgi:hypothetical protein
MNTPVPPARSKNRFILLLIVALFVGPIVVAWLYVSGVFDWHSRGIVNKGMLISPPIDLTQLGDYPSLRILRKLAPSEWAIVLIEPAQCTSRCIKTLDELLIIRELLGEGAVRASVHAIAAGAPQASSHAQRIHIDPEAISALTAALANRAQSAVLPLITLVDWRQQMMMGYSLNTAPANIQKDLKRLLRASKIR